VIIFITCIILFYYRVNVEMISISTIHRRFLKTQFKSAGIIGLQSTLFFSSQISMISSDKYLQIIHSQQNHLIVALSITSYPVVSIYDSLYKSVDEPTLNKIKELFGAHTYHC